MKEFLLLIRDNPEAAAQLSAEEMQECIERHVKWMEELVAKGQYKSGNPLAPDGKQISGAKRIVTDGPYMETKECVSGYFILLANTLEEATEIAQGCPSLDDGGSLELREIIDEG